MQDGSIIYGMIYAFNRKDVTGSLVLPVRIMAVLLLSGICLAACAGRPAAARFPRLESDAPLFRLFDSCRVPYSFQGGTAVVPPVAEAVSNLVLVLRALDLAEGAHRYNLANHSAVRGRDGKPCRRRFLQLVPGSVPEIREDHAAVRLVFDPTHPDAERSGVRRGWVTFPAINVQLELALLDRTRRQFRLVCGLLRRIAPGLVLPQEKNQDRVLAPGE